MRRFFNTEQLTDVTGEVMTFRAPPKKEGDSLPPERPLSLAQWIVEMLRHLPQVSGRMDAEDSAHMYNVVKVLVKTEPGKVFSLDEDDYTWLMKVLWQDSEVTRLVNPTLSRVTKAWGFNVFGSLYGMEIKMQLDNPANEKPADSEGD